MDLNTTTPETVLWRDMAGKAFVVNSSAFLLAMDVLVYPFDLLKTRQQFDESKGAHRLKLRVEARRILNTEGIRGLYRGFVPTTLGSYPAQLIYFTTYEYVKQHLGDQTGIFKDKDAPIWKRALVYSAAGISADIASLAIATPVDVVTQRLMVSTATRSTLMHFEKGPVPPPATLTSIFQTIWKSEGIRGLYRGTFASLAYFAPSSAIWWTTYETFKTQMLSMHLMPPFAVHFLAGGIAGATATILCNPLDVAKTRYQTFDVTIEADRQRLKSGFFNILTSTAREEGLRGLTRGLVPRLSVNVPGSAITMLGFELAKMYSLDKS